jgi:general secretion pathway protein I
LNLLRANRSLASKRVLRGFTLLEVLVSIAILGLGLTIVLSSQTGVFWSYQRATKLSQAPGLLRCKMEEIELDLLKEGYPLLDEQDDGECCEDTDIENYTCSWKIEKVELPELVMDDQLGGGAQDAGAGAGDEPSASAGGPLSVLATLQGGGLQGGAESGGLSNLAGMMGESGGPAGMASMVMGLVYPDLKPMLEASIRKITVVVHWKEGSSDQKLSVTQYVTNPQQGGLDPLAAEGVDEAADQALEAISGAVGAPAPETNANGKGSK